MTTVSKNDDLKALREELKELRETVRTMQAGAAGQGTVKYRYGLTLYKLESGHPYMEFLIPQDADGPTTLDDFAGLVRYADERLGFLFQQHFALQQAQAMQEAQAATEEVQSDAAEGEEGTAEDAEGD